MVCVYVHVCTCMCVHVCVYMCVCVQGILSTSKGPPISDSDTTVRQSYVNPSDISPSIRATGTLIAHAQHVVSCEKYLH